jgi:hypothetical protein
MKVRFQVSDHVYCLERESFYKLGEIVDLPEHAAKTYIEDRMVEPFEYSIDEDEIIELYRKFTASTLFEEKVDIYLKVIAKSNSHIQLKDSTKLIFEVTPNKDEEWYFYNTSMCDFYIKNFYRCRFDSFKDNFERKLINFPNYKVLIKKELAKIDEILKIDNTDGILYWYNAGLDGEIPLDGKSIKAFFSKKIYHGVEYYLQGKALFEYVMFLNNFLNELQNNNSKTKREKMFSEYLVHDEKERFAKELKNEFNTEIGKSIRLMIEALKQSQLLVIPDRKKKSFYRALKDYFKRDVGTYPSVFDYKLNLHSDIQDIQSVKSKIDSILKNMECVK